MSADVEIISGIPVVVSPAVPPDSAYCLNLRGQAFIAEALREQLAGKDFAVIVDSPATRDKLRGNPAALAGITQRIQEMQR